MRIKILLTSTILLSYLNVTGQEIRYFSPYFQNRSTEKTEQIRKYNVKETGVVIEDYKNEKLEISGTVVGTKSLDELDNFLAYIRSAGSEQHYKDFFKNLTGDFISYYEDGGHQNSIIFLKNKMYFIQTWNEAGEEMLTSGTGIYTEPSEDNEEDRYEVYKDSLLVAHYSVRRLQRDTIYNRVDKMATPKNGMQDFYQELTRVLKYPLVARFVGKEGLAYIKFIVDKNGKLTEFAPISKEGLGFEKKVIEKLQKFPDWDPAIFRKRNVKMRFVLPIRYKLTN